MSKDNTNSLRSDNDQNIDDINYFTNSWSRSNKTNWKIGQFTDDHVYLFNNMKDNFQDKLLENALDDENKDDENFAKILLLAT